MGVAVRFDIAPGTPCDSCGEPLKQIKQRKTLTCRTCHARRMSPGNLPKLAAAREERWADPNERARSGVIASENRRRRMAEDPAFAARLRENCRAMGVGGNGFNRFPKGSPERMAAGRRARATKLAWCPMEYRDEYQRLMSAYGYRAPEARAMIEEQVERDRQAYLATGQLQQAARA